VENLRIGTRIGLGFGFLSVLALMLAGSYGEQRAAAGEDSGDMPAGFAAETRMKSRMAFERLEKLLGDPKVQGYLGKAKAARSKFIAAQDTLVQLQAIGKQAQADDVLKNVLLPAQQDYLDLLDDLIKYQRSHLATPR